MLTLATVWVGTLLYTTHLDSNYDYNEDNQLISLDYFYKPDRYVGIVNLKNSFYENSSGVYWGVRKRLDNNDTTFGIRLGVLDGYREMYGDVGGPITTHGKVTLMVSPSVGYMLTDRVEVETILFGSAVSVGIRFSFK